MPVDPHWTATGATILADAICSPDGGGQDSQLRAGVATSRATPASAAAARASPAYGGMMTRFGTSLVNSCWMRFSIETAVLRVSGPFRARQALKPGRDRTAAGEGAGGRGEGALN